MTRDQLGLEPLYYWIKDPTVSGRSIRELLDKGVPRRLSLTGLKSYLEYGCVCEPYTLIEDVRCVLPGGDCATTHAWCPTCEDKAWTLASAQEAVTRALDEVMVETMAVHSERPNVAAFLSGGIDSSALVAMMRRLYDGEIRTYCVTHEDAKTDERLWAKRVADCNQTKHTELFLTGDYFSRHLSDAIASYDQPSLDGINFWFASKMVSELGEKTILSGEGGDEVFVGYGRFAKARQCYRIATMLGQLCGSFCGRTAGTLIESFAPNEKVRKLGALLSWQGDPYFLSRRVLSDLQIKQLLKRDLYNDIRKQPSYEMEWNDAFAIENVSLDEINAISWKEIRTVLLSMYLHDGWQVSQPFGLEVLAPLVHPKLISLLFTIPGALKCSEAYLKPLLVNAAGSGLPMDCVTRSKQGFTLPFDRYFTGVLKDEIETFLSGESLFFGAKALQKMGTHYHAGNVNWSRIWVLFMLEKWCKENKVEVHY